MSNVEIMPANQEAVVPEMLGKGLQMIRVDNESMQLFARANRRAPNVDIKKAALEELALSSTFAESAYYSLPPFRGGDGKRIEGISFSGATCLARIWGNCLVDTRVVAEDDDGFDVMGVFHDFETNFRITRPVRASKWIKRKDGNTQRLDAKRQAMEIGSAASKAQRNAILAGLPQWLKTEFFGKAREIVAGTLDAKAAQDKVSSVVNFFKNKFGVNRSQLETFVGKPADQWLGEDIANLRGVVNEFNDGVSSVADVFPAEGAAPVASVNLENFLRGEAKAE